MCVDVIFCFINKGMYANYVNYVVEIYYRVVTMGTSRNDSRR